MSVLPNECARGVLDTVPAVMRCIRTEMRRHRAPDMSVSQFRALAFLHRYPGASLSEVAEHTGLTLPSASRMLEALVVRRRVTRKVHPQDRRRLTLFLTRQGKALLKLARAATQAALTQRLAVLSAHDRIAVVQAMGLLQQIFAAGRVSQSGTRR